MLKQIIFTITVLSFFLTVLAHAPQILAQAGQDSISNPANPGTQQQVGGTTTAGTDLADWWWLIPVVIAIPLLIWAFKTSENADEFESRRFRMSGTRGGRASSEKTELEESDIEGY